MLSSSFHPPLHVLQRCSRHPESASLLQHRRGLLRADADVLGVQRLPGQPVHDAGAQDEWQHPGAGADRQPVGGRACHGHRHRVSPLLPGGQPALNCDIYRLITVTISQNGTMIKVYFYIQIDVFIWLLYRLMYNKYNIVRIYIHLNCQYIHDIPLTFRIHKYEQDWTVTHTICS